MPKRKSVQTYHYKCTITEQEFKTTREAPSPDELVSVKAWYELNPEEDDRPESVKKQFAVDGE